MDVRILGPLEVESGGRLVALGGQKQRALIAALALGDSRVVSSDALIDALWGERPPPTVQTALHGLVSHARKALGADRDRLATRPPGYVLHLEPGELDARRFERLVADGRAASEDGDAATAARRLADALALWRGPALADFAYDEFARDEATRLEELRLAALEDRIEADLALGRHAGAVPELEALVARHLLRERLRGQLMLALYRCGRQADALAAYADARRTLAHALGLDPGPQLQGLERAILRQDPALDLPPPPAPEVEPGAAPPDEMKPVTALFADVVGSTALGERLRADEAKALVGECVTAMSRAVEEHGGTIQAYTGDGICAYFGVPVAHADDPERAARAALRILDVMREYAADVEAAWGVSGFSVRVGVNSGQAAVGAVGAAAPQVVAAGDTTNVAARLETAAQPGTALVGPETAERLAYRFALEPVGPLEVKNRRGPVAASRLVGPARKGSAGGPPLIGRDGDLARVDDALHDLRAGRGQVLVVVGDAGIGKSRLLAEARARVGEGITWLEGQCLGYGGAAGRPVTEMLRGWLGIEEGDADIAVRTKTRAKLGLLFGDRLQAVLAPLTELLGGRTDASPTDADVRAAVCAWVEALASTGPVVVAIEDAHAADTPTRELVEDLIDLTDRAPLLVVVTLVGERGTEGWRLRLRALDAYAHRASELRLEPLSDDAAAELLAVLLPGALDHDARETLVRRAEGNPLYLEELLRALVQGGGIAERQRTWTLTSAAARLLPPALENLLVARIDRLGDGARTLAQVAAVVGRSFPVDVLRRAGDQVDERLAELLRAGVVREVRRYPELECAFRHGLLHEAVLSTLTPARRRELSARVAQAWQDHYGAAADPERLAHYHARAGDAARAAAVLGRT